MTLTAEERLEFEQAGLSPETIERLTGDGLTLDTLQRAIREVQEVIGPHGSVSRVQAGGVRIERGTGIGVFSDGIQKTTIDVDGNLFVGSDIESPSTTTFSVFVVDQPYNGEEFGAGDLLIGDNAAANIFYDASTGRLNFRGSSTVRAYIDTDGRIYAGGGDVVIDEFGINLANSGSTAWFRFEDAGGTFDKITIGADPNNDFEFTNLTRSPNGAISFFVKDTAGNTRRPLQIKEDPDNANVMQVSMDVMPSGVGSRFRLGSDVIIWAGRDGVATVFNDGSWDIDFRVEGATNPHVFVVDAGNDRVEFKDSSAIAVHIISATGAVYFNEPNGDVDFIVEGDTDGSLFWVDAGLDAIGIGGAAQSSFKLKVTGDTYFVGDTIWESGTVTINNAAEDYDFIVYADNGNATIYSDAGNARLGILTSTPGYPLEVAGDANLTSGHVYRINGTSVIDVNTRGTTTETNTNDIFRVNSANTSTFSGTINGTPSGTSVVYNAGFSGNENALVPASTSQLGKMKLFNTTRGTSALISDCNTGTNTITLTATVPGTWANGDTITIASQTVSGGTGNWVDIEVTSGPTGKSALWLNLQWTDTGAIASTTIARVHPTETFATSKIFALPAQVSTFAATGIAPVKMVGNVFTISWISTGATSGTFTIREAGYIL